MTDRGSRIRYWGKLRTAVRAVARRPALRVRVGPPVRLDDPRTGRFVDPTRPATAVAAYPGGVVPEDVP